MKILQVHQLNRMVNLHLQAFGELVVEGEISQMQVSQGRWLFMTIKDDQASVSVFAPAFKISTLNALEEGMKVHVHAVPGLYQKTGRFNLNAHQIVPAGEGALRLAYEKLKQKLETEGLFDPARKRSLPRFPERIALITAKSSRAYSDFMKILAARMGGIKIYFYPVQVQGKNSVASIVQAFEYFNNWADSGQRADAEPGVDRKRGADFRLADQQLDAIVLTRGGGSLEDLLSFNDELVARAVFASKIPVVSGIGHEEDIALTDLVADLRASTPSNVAELLCVSRDEAILEVRHLVNQMENNLKASIYDAQEIVDHQVSVLKRFFQDHFDRYPIN